MRGGVGRQAGAGTGGVQVNPGERVGRRPLASAVVPALGDEEKAAARRAIQARPQPAVSAVAVTATKAPGSAVPAPPPARAAEAASGTQKSPLGRRRVVAALDVTGPGVGDVRAEDALARTQPVTQALRFEPAVVNFGAVTAGAVYRHDVAVENGSDMPLPVTVPPHYTYHNADAGDGADVNTVCVVLPDDELGVLPRSRPLPSLLAFACHCA